MDVGPAILFSGAESRAAVRQTPARADVRLPPIADVPSRRGSACHGGGAELSPLAVAPGSDPADTAPEHALFQPKKVSATRFAERLRSGAGQRALRLGLTLAIEALKLPYAGLFVRFYSGAIATEEFPASRRQVEIRTMAGCARLDRA